MAAAAITLLVIGLPLTVSARPIRIACDGSVDRAVRHIVNTPEAQQTGVAAVILPAVDPADAIAALIDGVIDVLLIAHPLPVGEDGQNPLLAITEWARTPVVFAVHSQVPVSNLKLDELVALLAGWVPRWPDGTPVRLLVSPQSARDLLQVQSVSSMLGFAIDSAVKRPGMTTVHSDEDVADLLESVPGSAGFTSLSDILTRDRQVKPLLIDGVEPSLASNQLGHYRLERIISFVHREEPAPQVAAIVDYLRSDRHHASLLARGLLPARAPAAIAD